MALYLRLPVSHLGEDLSVKFGNGADRAGSRSAGERGGLGPLGPLGGGDHQLADRVYHRFPVVG